MTQDLLFSIIIPARDEEVLLPKCVQSLRDSASEIKEEIEIIVVANRCTDGTQEVANSLGCNVISNDAKNLSAIRNAGAKVARGKIIITVDADSTVSKNMLATIRRKMLGGRCVGGGVFIVPERLSLGIFFSGLCLLPIVLYYRILCGLFFCFREDFVAIGGFDESLCSVEDIDFAKRLRKHGRGTKRYFANLFSAYITTSCRKFDRFGDWFFLRRPKMTLTLLRGRNQAYADKVWYDFER